MLGIGLGLNFGGGQGSAAPFVPGPTTLWSATDAATPGAGGGTFTLDSVALTLSGPSGSGWSSVRTSNPKSSGLWYIEFACVVAGSGVLYGFGAASSSFVPALNGGQYLGSSSYSGGVFANGLAEASTGFATGSGTLPGVDAAAGDVFGLLINFTTGKIWIAKNNLNVQTGSAPNPSTDPAQLTFTPGTVGPLSPAMSMQTGNGSWVVQAASNSQKYAPSSGYTAWGSSLFFRNFLTALPSPTQIINNNGFAWNTFVSNAFGVDPAHVAGTLLGYTENSVDSTTYGSISEWTSTTGFAGSWTTGASPILSATAFAWDNSYLTSPWPITIGGVKRIYYSAKNSSNQITIGQAKWNGSTWVKWSGNPIFPSSSGFGDPCVLGPFGSTYYMFVANGYPSGPNILCYQSTDGDNWSYVGIAFGPAVSGDWDFGYGGWIEFYPFKNRYGFLEAFYIVINGSNQLIGYCIATAPNMLFTKLNMEIPPGLWGAGNMTMLETASNLIILGDVTTGGGTNNGVGVASMPL